MYVAMTQGPDSITVALVYITAVMIHDTIGRVGSCSYKARNPTGR